MVPLPSEREMDMLLVTGEQQTIALTAIALQRVGRSRSFNSELLIFEGCAHAPIYEQVAEFNDRTLAFMRRHTGAAGRIERRLRKGTGFTTSCQERRDRQAEGHDDLA